MKYLSNLYLVNGVDLKKIMHKNKVNNFSIIGAIFFINIFSITASSALAGTCKVNDQDISGDYSGGCVNGFANGKGKAIGRDTYIGNFKQGNKNRSGIYTWASGDRYEGEWKDDKRTGKGTYTYASGNRYEGEWKDGKTTGKGTLTWSNGDRYDGDWKDDKRTKGILTFANGDRYEGEFKEDQRNGYGINYDKDGREEGYWENNKLVSRVYDKRACDSLYAGKKVKAPLQGLVTLFGVKTEDAIVVGFSRDAGVATVRSINNSQMVGEVPCETLR